MRIIEEKEDPKIPDSQCPYLSKGTDEDLSKLNVMPF